MTWPRESGHDIPGVLVRPDPKTDGRSEITERLLHSPAALQRALGISLPDDLPESYFRGVAHKPKIWIGVVNLCALLFCGCTGIPREQLKVFVSSIDEAKTAAEPILADWKSARAEQDRLDRAAEEAKQNPQKAAALAVPIIRPGVDSRTLVSSEDVRALAWEAIAAYSAVLARLDAGDSVKDVKETTGKLFMLATRVAGSSVPGGDALLDLLQTFAAKLEKARLAGEFKKAVRDGAPILQKIIKEVLLKDIAGHYRLRATFVNVDIPAVDFDDDLTDADKIAKKKRLLDEFQAFSKSLDSYEQLLLHASDALNTLSSETNRSVDFTAQANTLLDVAFTLKQQWRAYENARKEGPR